MIVRPVEETDRNAWERLYRGYADYYRVATDDAKLQTLFGWLLDPTHVCEGLVAEATTGDLVGL
ncbi:MAG TPA: GNAT family N-acetyltransferase, partial [Alphaproteobacteria bacterium]|nr:GNAT family N-acetyltransferase [Alphaproteobacteria bacterium]